jgi:hypothetical protein
LRWPYRSIAAAEVARLRPLAQQQLPEFFPGVEARPYYEPEAAGSETGAGLAPNYRKLAQLEFPSSICCRRPSLRLAGRSDQNLLFPVMGEDLPDRSVALVEP